MQIDFFLLPRAREFAGWMARRARIAGAWVVPGMLALLAGLFWAGAAHSEESPLLGQAAWIESGQQVTVEQASTRFSGLFKPTAGLTVYPLGPDKTLWLRLRLQAPPGGASGWGLDLPVPLLDFVAVHQLGPDGKWSVQRAGDLLAVASWSRPGRFASFDLDLPAGPPRDVYVQVRHRDPIGFELRIAPAPDLEQARKLEYLALGMILGTLMLLTVWCLIQSGIHSDLAYAWYALFAAVMTLTMASVTGVAGHLLWNQSPFWSDRAQGVLPIMLAGINILFLRHLCSIGARYPRVDVLALTTAVLVLMMGVAYMVVDGQIANAFVAFSLVASLVLTFTLAGLAWRRGDVVGGWVLLAYVPLALTIVVVVLRLYGWMTRAG